MNHTAFKTELGNSTPSTHPVEGHPTLFTIKLYHGGEFTNFRDRKYIDGKVNYVDMVDIDEFSIHDLDAIMRGLRNKRA
ncbi:hypothetical protein LXL04_014052 [Taraxacum kok-saghyz]